MNLLAIFRGIKLRIISGVPQISFAEVFTRPTPPQKKGGALKKETEYTKLFEYKRSTNMIGTTI